MMELSNHNSNDRSHLKRTDSLESPSEDGHFTDNVLELVQKEIGCDVKSLKNVAGLLEKLTLENKQLEEQVKQTRRYWHISNEDKLFYFLFVYKRLFNIC